MHCGPLDLLFEMGSKRQVVAYRRFKGTAYCERGVTWFNAFGPLFIYCLVYSMGISYCCFNQQESCWAVCVCEKGAVYIFRHAMDFK